MADETETPTEPAAPSPPRRRAPRSTTAEKGESKSPVKTPAAKRARTGKTAAKPAESSDKPAKAKREPAKPRAAKRASPAPKRRQAPKSTVEKATEKVGGRWGAAAIAGAVGAVGAAAALLTLRGSSAKPTPKPVRSGSTGSTRPIPVEPAKPERAHTPDGTDASKSFQAGIADENTIPEG